MNATVVKRKELQNARVEEGLTRPQLAEILGVSSEHVKSLEYGRVNPSPQLLFRIVGVFSKPPEVLFPDIASPVKK
ncbi:anaerobic benzoate catabolism transcriptional regulator [compost metagenome]